METILILMNASIFLKVLLSLLIFFSVYNLFLFVKYMMVFSEQNRAKLEILEYLKKSKAKRVNLNMSVYSELYNIVFETFMDNLDKKKEFFKKNFTKDVVFLIEEKIKNIYIFKYIFLFVILDCILAIFLFILENATLTKFILIKNIAIIFGVSFVIATSSLMFYFCLKNKLKILYKDLNLFETLVINKLLE